MFGNLIYAIIRNNITSILSMEASGVIPCKDKHMNKYSISVNIITLPLFYFYTPKSHWLFSLQDIDLEGRYVFYLCAGNSDGPMTFSQEFCPVLVA